MLGLSERIIRALTDITNSENAVLPGWIDQNYVAKCIIPPLKAENDVHCNIAVVAPVSAGKSTLFNALCGYPILPAASKTTSAVPTYITRTSEQAQECITVYGLKKVVTEEQGITSTQFVRDTAVKRTYFARDITEGMFEDLFRYMYFVTHGVKHEDNSIEYKTTVENVAYFMKSDEMADVLFNGEDLQKFSVTEDDFTLSYNTPRHRLLLLSIFLCVYVDQNDDPATMSQYTKDLNRMRLDLLKRYKFPTDGDYCVCLDWCSEDIPKNVTLIDLPGTGSSTENTETKSSHTALVRGILGEADAIWVLCSTNGTVDPDLSAVIDGVLSGNSRKNKVCIYNCINKKPHESGPVIDFLKKLPCLTGERCYVVDALAGEYKYTQNGVNALRTKTASDMRCVNFDEPSEAGVLKKLGIMYNGEKCAYCTFSTQKDESNTIIAAQDSGLKYTLDTFFKSALAEYVERLKYEVSLTQAIEQAKFYIYIRDSLASSRSILEGIDGKSEEISLAVSAALTNAKDAALNNYVNKMVSHQTHMDAELKKLGAKISGKIKNGFKSSLSALIAQIKNEWRTLEKDGHPNRLEANIFGNYPLGVNHNNWAKFKRVRDKAESMVTVSAFDSALKIANDEIKDYNTELNKYVNGLKNITNDFVNDYVNAFVASFDKKRDEFCKEQITGSVYQNFNSTRDKLKDALTSKLNALSVMVCDSFDVLTDHNGIFDQLCTETDKVFRDKFCENILSGIRKFMYQTFTDTNYIGVFVDRMRPEDLHNILNNDFAAKEKEYTQALSNLVDAVYGIHGASDSNFPSNLSVKVNKFNSDKIVNGANKEIDNTHDNILSLVGFGASLVVDVSEEIKKLDGAIGIWSKIGGMYQNIDKLLEDSDGENTKRLYVDCKEQLDIISSKGKV